MAIENQSDLVSAEDLKNKLMDDPRIAPVLAEREAVWAAALFIKSAREAAGLTQQALAELIGVSQPRIAVMERAHLVQRGSIPSLPLLIRIGHVCNKKFGL